MGQAFKIDKLNVEDILSLSPMQEGMLFHYLKDPDSEQYFEQLSLSMLGKIDMVIFEKAWDFVTAKNEMLRTLFRWDKLDKPVQIILKKHNTKIFTYDFCCKEVADSIKKLGDAKIEDKNNKFDLREVPFRVTLCKLGESKYEMIVTNHHILYDGWSTGVILQDFLYAYDTLAKDQSLVKKETFRLRESIKYLNEKNKELEELYWEEYLRGFEGENLIQMKLEDVSVRKLDQYTIDISEDFMREIDIFTKDKKMTLAELVYCAWGILLQKYANRRDIVFGTTVSGRNTKIKGIENAVGLFINTLPLRIENNTNKSIMNLLLDVKQTVRQRELYETTSLVDIKKYSGINGKKDLFDSLVVVENYPLDNLLNKRERLLDIVDYSIEEQTNYPLTLSINRSEHLKLTLTYDKSFMNKEYIENMSEHFVNILRFITKESEKSIAQMNILTERESNQILYEFNDTKADYPKDKTVYELFEEQVEKTPDNVAVVFEDKQLTYKELNEKSNSLARVLRAKGIKSDSIVGLLVDRSLEMVIGIMSILKAGGAYLPIDTNYPKERIEYMLKDSESQILLSTEDLLDNIEFNGQAIDLLNKELFEGQQTNLEKINTPNDLIYVIYTSGTTGNPKGTIVKHQSFTNLMQWYDSEFKISEKDNVLLMASISFDLAQKNIYAPLIVGGKLTLANKGIINYEKANKAISENKITIINCAPSMFNPIMEFNKEKNYVGLKSLKHVFLGGEPINLKKLNDWINAEACFCKIVNTYGPTECTDIATFYSLKKEESGLVPIGKPINNVKLYILDKDKKLVPVGVQGELYIAGEGVSRGYLNRTELTLEKFVENPFELGTKMYSTGDLTKWLPDGNIEFLGRIDNQVKIRGFRIELEEIENALLKHKDIKEAAVMVKENKENEKYICAYVVCEKEISDLNIRGYLKEGLPEYMVPAYFVQLEEMPLTQNGKLDKKALPEPGLDATLNEYEAPTNEIEEKLVEIWSEVLGLKRVGINDDFFELGGHSLKATTLVSKIHKNLNVEVPLKEIFKSSTIKGISEYIKNTEKNIYQEIKIVEEKEYYAVSSAQKRMYMLQQFDLTSTSYNMPGVLEIEGILDIERLENAFSKLIERHQTLRTSFENIEGEIVQKVNSNIDFKVDYANIEKTVEEVALDKENLISSFVRAFDLSKAPLLRVGIVRTENAKHTLMFDMHHIISDGASMGILTKEFVELYDGNNLEEIKIQYKDFSAWQNNLLKSEKMKKQEEYWLQKYSSEIPVLSMPVDFTRPSMQSFEGDSIGFKLDKELTSDLNKISKETGSTMYMTLLSGISILLSKYSGQEDLVIGSPISGRPHADLDKIIGVFVNTLAMRNRPEGSKSYKEFLMEVKENALRAYENQEYQFEELVEKLSIRRDISRNPLFDVMFTMQNMDSSEIELKNLKFKEYKNNNKIAKFDLTFTAVETSEEVSMDINYCTKLFKKETVERIVEHFKNILKTVVRNTNIKLSEIEMISEEEKNKLLYDFNDTKADYPKDKTIYELFEEQVEKTPNNVALVFENKYLTYKELNEKSNSLARVLKSKGIKSDSMVGLLVDRSLEMVIGIMAILKAGGAYLPIDTNYPKERIEYMLKDSESHILLSTAGLQDNIEFNGQMIDLLDKELFEGQLSNLEKINNPNDLVYVIYTSGTTGNPKGTIVKHQSFTNLMQWYDSEFEISEKDNVLLMASISFDLAQKNIYAPLIVGGKLTLANKGIVNYEKVNKVINENKITIINCAPSMFNPIMEFNKETDYADLKSLKYIFLGGEPINLKKLNDWINSEECFCKIVNTYGPTECTDIATFYSLRKEEISPVPIGKPINNVKLYILDKDKKLVPVGVQGELYIGGDGLSRGYLNRPELTVEKFVENPFEIGTKIYKTGDLTKWLPDGNIEFLGRVDNQVKIRGFRIELEEIENTILKHKDIKEAAIVVKENKENEKYICAYVVCEKEISELNIRGYLKEGLPDYMVPAYFVQLEEMPLTQNGKLDKKALPEPSLDATLNEYEAPTNEAEEKLVEIWSEVLGVESIGINHNFFDLGGHSLKATTLVSKIHRELNVEVPLKEIFKSPTIKGISEYIQKTEKNIYEKIQIVEEKEYYEVSSAQKRMYMLQQFDLQSTSYNIPGILEVEGKFDIQRLEIAFNKLIKRHETLRTSFEDIKGEIVQKVNSGIDFKADYINIEKTIEEVALDKETLMLNNYQHEKLINEEIGKLINSFLSAFDLSRAPLLRVGVIKVSEVKHLIMFDMHHIISDGVSMGILTKEFVKLYDGKDLEKVNVQYKDFSAWQNKFLKSEKMKKQEEYWLQNFSGEIPVLNMPMDFIRPSMQSFQGDSINIKLDKELTRELNKVAKETGSTMYMVLLSAINILLSKYSGQEDLIIGSTIAGRPHADLEGIIGMFVNAIAMRNHPQESKNYKDFLKEVKENALKAYENQDYQFEELVEKLNIRRDISRNPLFDIMFTMQNMDSTEIHLKDLKFNKYKNNNKVAKFDLTFFAVEGSEEISIDIDYCTELFKRETIERMVEHFGNILKLIGINADVKISELDILSESERNKLLFEFNDTYRDYPRNKTIHQIFEEQVEKIPNNIAVVFEDKQLTYRELNEKSNRLAKTLREKGVKQDTKVGVMLERSLEMIVGVIGILKAGGAFLPVAPEYPEDRIIHMLEDSEVRILLTQTDFSHKVEFNGEIINLEEAEAYSDNTENLEHINSSKDLVYVLYTSGSTGKPKGAMIEHKGLINTLNVLEESCPVSDKDSYLLKTNCVFDVSVIELFTWFFGSGKLVILPNGLEKEPLSIAKAIQKNNVTHINFTPSMVSVFFNSLNEEYTEIISSLKYIILGGEAVQKENIEKIRRILTDVKIENIYGPTEFSIFVTRYSIKDLKSNIPIGPPVNNTKCYILGKNKNLLPVGVVGELCLSGDGVSRGYVNRPELTAEKFVEDPFNQGQLMYKTGDLARWLPDGNIEFLGRIDHQVKIRGFRIELGEIENVLLNYKSVKEVVVVDRKDSDGDKYLCAYITCHKEVIVSELRKHLLKNLPEYMVPAYFIQLENMPLTSNGKVDRRALPEPDSSMVVGTEYEAPRNVIEEKLVDIWSEVLGVEKVGIHDNFFELGGHSLKAIQLTSLLHKRLNIKIGLQEVFNLPTVELLSKVISNRSFSTYKDIRPLSKQDHYELSYAQRRLWIINKTNPNSTAYNMPGCVTLHENVDENIMKLVFNELIYRHEGLRTRFKVINGEPVQIIDEVTSFNLEIEDISNLHDNELVEARNKIYNQVISRVFDLEVASLIYVKLVKIKDEQYDLIYCMHHIISDGFSLEVLRTEFYSLYNAYKKEERCILEPLNIQYKDFAAWQNQLIKDKEGIQAAKSFWNNQLNRDMTILQLPFSYPNTNITNRDSAGYRIVLSENQKDRLKILEKEYNTSLFVVLVTSFNLFLAKLTNQKDILIGTAGFGRDHDALKNIIGCFINTTILRNEVDSEESFVELLGKININTLKALEYQNYPIELMLDELNISYPKISAFFNMLNMGDSNKQYIEDPSEYHINKMQSVKFDMAWYITEYANGIEIICSYLLELFEPSRMEYIMGMYMKVLNYILENPNKKLKDYKLTESKRKFSKS
jgi:amino acid adenylation domain-containing protein